ncbi:MED6 mediator sub complex component-domain-containing protein [Vararia minispora EC-137]|uniref:MED6 mediator sub complex component-domain-containing protein n=1 Tax=Vararia minispora EC-137 TaxID=1314806 RepID=A0ACB8QB70_9AGAM|nr:MED6 mediator sub complex component-domain-containing protein [Vararia minispora EC-137]
MDNVDYHAEDYSHRYFVWPEFIQARGPVTTENLFDFLQGSPFWDRSSTNDQLRMQTRHTGIPVADEAEELKRFIGIEFALVHHRPPSLFVVQKRERVSSTETSRPLATYFVLHNRAYLAPDIYRVLSSRLLSSVSALQSSFDTLSHHRPGFTPRTGFAWPIVASIDDGAKQRRDDQQPTDSQQTEDMSMQDDKEAKSGKKSQSQNVKLLEHAMIAAKLHSKLPESIEARAAPAIMTPAGAPSRASATPAPSVPASHPTTTPGPSTQEPPAKGVPGAGKKKRKRTLVPASGSS